MTVPGVHCWPQAPDHFGPLRTTHRHLFTIDADVQTDHGNRAVEFIQLGQQIREYLTGAYPRSPYWDCVDFRNLSCEMIASDVLLAFNLDRVTVWEDMENAGVAERGPEDRPEATT